MLLLPSQICHLCLFRKRFSKHKLRLGSVDTLLGIAINVNRFFCIENGGGPKIAFARGELGFGNTCASSVYWCIAQFGWVCSLSECPQSLFEYSSCDLGFFCLFIHASPEVYFQQLKTHVFLVSEKSLSLWVSLFFLDVTLFLYGQQNRNEFCDSPCRAFNKNETTVNQHVSHYFLQIDFELHLLSLSLHHLLLVWRWNALMRDSIESRCL